ncbi:MAG: hypothetical protein HGA25_06890 [Clostridiales bacterium]|nr:hypothetical protein [Clostridiales bacterium]
MYFFLEAVSPEVVLISCGENNTYGHPGKRVIELLKEDGITPMITMETGAIEIRIQNQKEFYVYIYAN